MMVMEIKLDSPGQGTKVKTMAKTLGVQIHEAEELLCKLLALKAEEEARQKPLADLRSALSDLEVCICEAIVAAETAAAGDTLVELKCCYHDVKAIGNRLAK